MKIILHTARKFSLLFIAALMVVMSIPPTSLYAQGEQEATGEAGSVTLEEFYRESEIEFFGKDLSDCTGGGGGAAANISVGKDFSLGTDPKERRVNLVKALMRDFGLKAEQASGIVGNFMHESGGEHLPPNINFGGEAGPPNFNGPYGWAQWLGGRLRGFINYAVDNGFMASDKVDATDAANYAWLTVELTGSESVAITEVTKANTPEDAARKWEASFERSGGAGMSDRIEKAKKVYAELIVGAVEDGEGPVVGEPGCSAAGDAALVGDKAFPLITTRADMESKNPGLFKDNTTGKGGHPYTAFDILADPDTQVVAFMSGTVTTITEDRCPGRMISIYNKDSNVTISYLHMNMNPGTHIAMGTQVKPGDPVGLVGPPGAGCGTPHLHIDAAKGESRPGCSRLDCPSTNASRFVDIGPDLFATFEALKH